MSDGEGKKSESVADQGGQKVSADAAANDMDDLPEADIKVILLGDSAVGKSKLVERFLSSLVSGVFLYSR